MAVSQADFDKLSDDFEEWRADATKKATECEVRVAGLAAKVELMTASLAELKVANAALNLRLLDMASGRIARADERADKQAERADSRYKLLLDRFGAPVGKALGVLAGLAFTALASWWAGRLGMGLPVSPMPAPTTLEALEAAAPVAP